MLLQPLLRHARDKADTIAITDDRGSITYAQLRAMSAGLSRAIAASTNKDRIGVLLPSGSAFAASFYGALMAGKSIVPINFLLSPQQVGHMVVDSGIDTILTAPPLAEKFAALPARLLDITALPAGAAPAPADVDPPHAGDSDLAIMLYTSGTSGMPKGVPLTHGNLHATVEGCVRHVFRGSGHHFLGLVPLFHSTGFTGTLLAPMQLGAPVTYLGRFSPVATLNAIKAGCDIAIAVPSMYGAMLSLKSATREDFAHVFALICGGEPLPGALRDAFEAKFGVPLLQGYGLSETCGPIAVNAPHARRDGSVGQVVPGGAARVIDDNGKPLEGEATGEILLGGPGIMSGYHNLPEATREAMTDDGFFRTGDLGHVDADGYLFITGRAKDMIIIGGEKLAPRELEEVLAKHPSIADVAVVGRKDESRGEAAVAFVVAREGQAIEPNVLKDFLKKQDLPNWKLPKEFIVVTELPRSPTGKVLKRELAAQLA
jgi:long-chain acyl-CoA synthetase